MQRIRRTSFNHTFALTLILLGLALAPAWAATLRVPQDFATIQASLDAAAAGDTVRVASGIFEENLTMATPNVTLRGNGDSTVLDPEAAGGIGITVTATGVTIRDLLIREGRDDAVFIDGVAGTRIEDVTILKPLGDCIETAGGDQTTVIDSTLQACNEHGVLAGTDDVTVEDTKIEGCGQECIEVTGQRARIEGNRITRAENSACVRIVGDDADVVKNHISLCGGDRDDLDETVNGIFIDGDNPEVSLNGVSRTSGDGIRIICDSCSGGKVSWNWVSDMVNDGDGIEVTVIGTGGFQVERNRVERVTADGIEIDGDNVSVRKNRVTDAGSSSRDECYNVNGNNNRVKDNVAQNCAEDAIQVFGNNNVVEDNHVREGSLAALEAGIDIVSGDGNRVKDNRVRGVLGNGIEISSDVSNTVVQNNNVSGSGLNDFCDEGSSTTSIANDFDTTAITPCQRD